MHQASRPPGSRGEADVSEPSIEPAEVIVVAGPVQPATEPAVRHEWSAFLSDPPFPQFLPDHDEVTEGARRVAAPAEQGLWRDLSLARRMQQALRSSEAHFEAAFRVAPTAMLVASLGGGRPARLLRVNPALSRLTGYPATQLLGFGFADLERAGQPQAGPHAPCSAGSPEEPHDRVRRWVCADGSEISVRIRMAVVPSSSDPAGELLCHIEDVTAVLVAAAAASSTDAQLRLAFDHAPQPAVLVELTGTRPGRLVSANRAARHLFGRSDLEISWLNLAALTDASHGLEILDLIDRLASGEVSHHEGEYAYQAAAGHPSRLVLSAHAVPGENGMPESALAYLQDVPPPTLGIVPATGPPLRVLLAEDDRVSQKVAQLMLRALGHDVDVVTNGQEALEALASASYDVVLMDIQMPVMDGFEATKHIRADLPTPRQPRILALTGCDEFGRDAYLTAGMDGYLAKPVREVDLRDAFVAALQRRADAQDVTPREGEKSRRVVSSHVFAGQD